MSSFRPIFRRTDVFTVVKPIRLTSDVRLLPGEEVSLQKGHKSFQLLNWYRRRFVGQKNSEWVKDQLKLWDARTKRSSKERDEMGGEEEDAGQIHRDLIPVVQEPEPEPVQQPAKRVKRVRRR